MQWHLRTAVVDNNSSKKGGVINIVRKDAMPIRPLLVSLNEVRSLAGPRRLTNHRLYSLSTHVPVTTIRSVPQFADFTSERYYKGNPRGTWIFRGQSNINYLLIPNVGRPAVDDLFYRERTILNKFRLEYMDFLPARPSNDWEWLALAQHHGLPTRLLDWSFNSLVALYFAVEDVGNQDSDGMVFALYQPSYEVLRNNHSTTGNAKITDDPLNIQESVRYEPHGRIGRIECQNGLFTVQREVTVPLDQQLHPSWKMERIHVPAENKKTILQDLYKFGFNRRTLFPDLDGLAADGRWTALGSLGVSATSRDIGFAHPETNEDIELIATVTSCEEFMDSWIFRAHTRTHSLIPSVGRETLIGNAKIRYKEKELLNNFRSRGTKMKL